MSDTLALITARVPPAICGVGDYTYRLWEAWPAPKPRRVLVVEGAEASQAAWPEVTIAAFDKSEPGLLAALEEAGASTAVLQYVGFGFHPKGTPVWLPSALRRWKAGQSGRRLVVMVHEIWGRARPPRPAWFRQFTQRRILRQLGELADGVLTGTDRHRQGLRRLGIEAVLSPIPSNIPVVGRREKEKAGQESQKLRLVIFGKPPTRLKAIQTHRRLLTELVRIGRLERVQLIGQGLLAGELPRAEALQLNGVIPSHRVEAAGELPPEAISRTLAQADLMLTGYPPSELGKSGGTQAALAHGLAVVSAGGAGDGGDGPPAFVYEGSAGAARRLAERLDRAAVDAMGRAAQAWYDRHSGWTQVAKIYQQAIGTKANL